jgi:hypothetical protein
MTTRGPNPRARLVIVRCWQPARIARTVPTTGSKATEPGKGIVSLIPTAASTIIATPSGPAHRVMVRGMPRDRATATARKAPIPNSQARAGAK